MTPPPALSTEGGHKKAYVYLLRSLSNRKFYLGWTTNLERRLKGHNFGLTQSTKSRQPFKLLYYEVFDNIELAKERERKLKKNPNMYFYFKKRVLNIGPKGRRQVVG